jgi:hypothetical protein
MPLVLKEMRYYGQKNGLKFGPKRSSTRAKVTGETDADILTHLENSPVHAITDENHFKYTMDNKNEKN